MTNLTRFALRNFIPVLIAAFFVVWFVFIMQHLWLYIDDFIGKGLDGWTVFKTIGLQSLVLIPVALPLGVLFAAIMSFGNIGESSELTALKSSGISVIRFSRPLIVFISLLSIASYFFNDIVIPKAQIKAIKTYYDIVNKKPAVNIRAREFYKELPNHIIYIGSKDRDNQTIRDVKIYDQTDGQQNQKIVIAKKGKMYVTDDKNFLIFELQDGWRYEEKENGRDETNEQIRLGFKYWKKVFDLSDFKMGETSEDYFKNLRTAMTMKQISKQIDTSGERIISTYVGTGNIVKTYLMDLDSTFPIKSIPTGTKLPFYKILIDTLLPRVANSAEISARSVKNTIEINKQNLKLQLKTLAEQKVEFHKRLTLPFACLVLFIIGAALGSIIRKGGLGMPFIWAVGFFVFYYVLNTIGEKLAREMITPVWQGMWMPSTVLSLLGIFLIIKANNDSPIMNKEWYFRLWKKLKSTFKAS